MSTVSNASKRENVPVTSLVVGDEIMFLGRQTVLRIEHGMSGDNLLVTLSRSGTGVWERREYATKYIK